MLPTHNSNPQQSFVCGLLVVQITKLVVGRTRPDFLARCNPIIPGNITITIGGDPNALWPCQRPYDDVLKDGFQSFPSGTAGVGFAALQSAWCASGKPQA